MLNSQCVSHNTDL